MVTLETISAAVIILTIVLLIAVSIATVLTDWLDAMDHNATTSTPEIDLDDSEFDENQ